MPQQESVSHRDPFGSTPSGTRTGSSILSKTQDFIHFYLVFYFFLLFLMYSWQCATASPTVHCAKHPLMVAIARNIEHCNPFGTYPPLTHRITHHFICIRPLLKIFSFITQTLPVKPHSIVHLLFPLHAMLSLIS